MILRLERQIKSIYLEIFLILILLKYFVALKTLNEHLTF